MEKEIFIKILDILRKQFKYILRIERVIGCEITPAYQGPQDVINVLESSTGVEWSDDIWKSVFDDNLGTEQLYNDIMEFVENMKKENQEEETHPGDLGDYQPLDDEKDDNKE